MSNKEKGQIIISIAELLVLNAFAGIAVDVPQSVFHEDDEQLETKLIIEQDVKVHDDDGNVMYEGIAAYLEEYQSEGWQPLRLTHKEGEGDE